VDLLDEILPSRHPGRKLIEVADAMLANEKLSEDIGLEKELPLLTDSRVAGSEILFSGWNISMGEGLTSSRTSSRSSAGSAYQDIELVSRNGSYGRSGEERTIGKY